VIDRIRQQWEVNYLQHFMKWNPIILQEDLGCDIALMRDCKRLIHSNSTLCWIISFLSKIEKERYIPVIDKITINLGYIDKEKDQVFDVNRMTQTEIFSL